jgi:predicted kinase
MGAPSAAAAKAGSDANASALARYRNNFLKEVEERVEEGAWVKMCMQCGVCAGSCPFGAHWEHSPQKLFMMIRAGKRDEVLSSDALRAVVSNDEADMAATADAFELLHLAASRRLARGLLTVVDATNVRADARTPLLELARRYRSPAVAVVFDLPVEVAAARNGQRPGRSVPRRVLRQQQVDLQRTLGELADEGFTRLWLLRTPSAVDALEVRRGA